jgi:hypothetical protein
MTRAQSARRRVWTHAEVEALGVRTDVPTAGEIIAGLCRDESYRAVKRGTFPVPVIEVGRRLVVPVAPILALLGIGPDMETAGPAPPDPADHTAADDPSATRNENYIDHATRRRRA